MNPPQHQSLITPGDREFRHLTRRCASSRMHQQRVIEPLFQRLWDMPERHQGW